MEDILNRILDTDSIQDQQQDNETALEKFKKEFLIDDNIEYPEPEYLVEIGGTPTMPKGNIVALSAKWKNGKTFFCDIVSAIFLGSQNFNGCRALCNTGKVTFFDTEQAISDTARIRRIIKRMTARNRHRDLQVYCLRNAEIENDEDDENKISRFEFIQHIIKQEKPALVVIDGIADLIYNYNDVNESQEVVNKLAAIANECNTCVIVVMHQNKSKGDKNMKGHLGTMLFQKCSDVFSVEKIDQIFIVNHQVSRHKSCDDFVFCIDPHGTPVDATEQRRFQKEKLEEKEKRELREELNNYLDDMEVASTRSTIAELIIKNGGKTRSTAFRIVRKAIAMGVLETIDRRHFFIRKDEQNTESVSSVPTVPFVPFVPK